MTDTIPKWLLGLLVALVSLWLGSIGLVVAPMLGLESPVRPTAAGTLSNATASIILVIVTTWHVTSHRELVEETREARLQEISPLLVPEFPGGLTPGRAIYLRNIGNGPAFDVTCTATLLPTGEETLLWESAPVLPPGYELQTNHPIHGGDKKEAFDREKFFSENTGLIIEVDYVDSLDREQKYIREFDFDFQYEMHNPQPIEE